MAMTNSNDYSIRIRHVPQRTCLACRKVKPKQELVRLVRVTDSGIEVDAGGKKTGRGTYLCRLPECWEVGLKSGRLEHALKTVLTASDREQLGEYAKSVLLGVSE
jgi:predicted RNA-binding protein YlxR (DUF448 family)